VTEIIEMLNDGYSPSEVSSYFGYSVEMVEQIASEYGIVDDAEYDDSMDGDFDSAMASAGFGTDEDYGYYGDE
jgi:hypothetical protein